MSEAMAFTETIATLALFALLLASAIAIAVTKRLFAVVILSGVFSLLAALLFVVMDAWDVAFTEAAVGAGISTVLMLGTIALTAREAKPSSSFSPIPFAVVVLVGIVLVYGTLDMPAFGDPNAPVPSGVARDYILRTPSEIDIPNVVTSVLSSYRGFDTLGEVVVVFTAGLGVVLLLSQLGRRGMRDLDLREETRTVEQPGPEGEPNVLDEDATVERVVGPKDAAAARSEG